MILADYSARKRHDMLWEALNAVLQDLSGSDSSTYDVAGMLMTRLGVPAKESAMVLTWLRKVAPLVPEASHTGAVVKAYGCYGRRWIWSQRTGLAPAAAVDTQDW